MEELAIKVEALEKRIADLEATQKAKEIAQEKEEHLKFLASVRRAGYDLSRRPPLRR